MPLLEGTDGIKKMSKSFGNYIGIDELANEMFGKIMSISDELMCKYYELLTDEDLDKMKKMHPKVAKLHLAESIVQDYHGAVIAKKAKENFERIFSQKELPKDLPLYKIKGKTNIIDILVNSGLVVSKNAGRRLIKQGGVYLDGERIDKAELNINKEGILKVGKRHFLRLKK
jgi:tyrosyl-tRNA synthetase